MGHGSSIIACFSNAALSFSSYSTNHVGFAVGAEVVVTSGTVIALKRQENLQQEQTTFSFEVGGSMIVPHCGQNGHEEMEGEEEDI